MYIIECVGAVMIDINVNFRRGACWVGNGCFIDFVCMCVCVSKVCWWYSFIPRPSLPIYTAVYSDCCCWNDDADDENDNGVVVGRMDVSWSLG